MTTIQAKMPTRYRKVYPLKEKKSKKYHHSKSIRD